ncbi:hypothetical protein GGF32_003391 [Allomyces javanicus]|nr:hypothetical protein GGF32_003391 [Allomyces javanicus]
MTRPPASSRSTTPTAASKRHRRHPSHPGSATDPASNLSTTELATGAPAPAATDLNADVREITVDPAHGGTEADLAA